jgi:hypothetical protein
VLIGAPTAVATIEASRNWSAFMMNDFLVNAPGVNRELRV